MAQVERPGNPLVSSHRVPLDQPRKGLLTRIVATHRADAAKRFDDRRDDRSRRQRALIQVSVTPTALLPY